MMRTTDALWEQLLAALNTWACAAVTEPDRITVKFADNERRERTATIAISPSQWDEYVSIPWGEFKSAIESLQRRLLELPTQDNFLVYHNYELVPSLSATIPHERVGSIVNEDGESGGRWVAFGSEDPESRI